MGYGQQNPLVAPTQANTALPPPTRAPWSPYEILQTLIGLVLLVFAGLQAVPTIRSIAPAVSNVFGVGLLVAVGALFIAYGATPILRRRIQERRRRESATATPDRVTELAVLIEKARKTWGAGANYVGSLDQASLDILNRLNQGAADANITEERRRAADRANYVIMGRRASSATQDAVFWELDRLIDDLRTTDTDTFVTALLLLRQVLLGGISVANVFADEVRRCDPPLVQDYLRQEWSDFRDKANRLSEDINTLGEKIKRDYGLTELSFYFPSVRSITND
jgi:hypothetical protein